MYAIERLPIDGVNDRITTVIEQSQTSETTTEIVFHAFISIVDVCLHLFLKSRKCLKNNMAIRSRCFLIEHETSVFEVRTCQFFIPLSAYGPLRVNVTFDTLLQCYLFFASFTFVVSSTACTVPYLSNGHVGHQPEKGSE